MAAFRVAAFVLGALLLGGCAPLPATQGETPPLKSELAAFSLEARFSLNRGDTHYSGRLSWRHDGPNNELMLVSPFGQGMAEITTNTLGARLITSDGKEYTAPDAVALTRQVLGYPLPLDQLTDWVRGRGPAFVISELDAQGRLLRFRHEGWHIEYGYPGDDANALPERIFAEDAEGLKLRMHIDEWRSLPAGAMKP
ncbi:lipoprotein insertase outer membrane protein LolB [Propionivibrio sp.]|uniref:lipoprotein insertase outer membrane protein LolB n=1 Tax=Propionivibrio sp. TaxID=2212460 RepID=UPI0025DD2A7F|nr:lipoprotein insertase outer membrane protein LolB [Propionivibrio sp.]MBK7355339.1 outer membrane lipoprotein LolB [Propionivibrio sp.]MBK8743370.1 outer membrane lipoprotein LolB [Propionivibrio sp.]MBL0207090.1 outer membrane lipoprotein LolB [Propionivibrio sp.]